MFGAKSEAMNAEQRDIFEETLAADQVSLEAQLAALQVATPDATRGVSASDEQPRHQPKRKALPAHLPRVDQRIELEDTDRRSTQHPALGARRAQSNHRGRTGPDV